MPDSFMRPCLVDVDLFDLLVNFVSYRKQLSGYLPSSVLKQKKKSSTVASEGKKEVCSANLTHVTYQC